LIAFLWAWGNNQFNAGYTLLSKDGHPGWIWGQRPLETLSDLHSCGWKMYLSADQFSSQKTWLFSRLWEKGS
jgi:hypothetical protein